MIVRRIINLTRIKTRPCFSYTKNKADQYEHDLIYGINPVEAAIHANRREIVSLMVSDSDRIELSSKVAKLIHIVRDRNIPVSFAPKEKLNRVVDHQPHQNLVLKCSKLQLATWEQNDLPEGVSLYCDKITDPQNFGAVLRSALFFGVSAVFTGKKNHCPLNSTVSKTSSGAMELMDVYGIGNSTEFVSNWKSKGGHVVATGVDPNRPHSRVQ